MLLCVTETSSVRGEMSHQSNTGNRIHLQWICKSLLVPFVCVAMLATAIGIAAAANTAGPGDGTYGGYTTHYWALTFSTPPTGRSTATA